MKIVNKNEFDELIKTGVTLVDFYADWCGPCKLLSPILEDISIDYPDIKFVKVNVDNDEELAMRYGIMSIPTIFIFKDNQLIGNMSGYRPKDGMKSFIDSTIKGA